MLLVTWSLMIFKMGQELPCELSHAACAAGTALQAQTGESRERQASPPPGVPSLAIGPGDPTLRRCAHGCVLQAQRNFTVTYQFFTHPEVSL